MHIKKQRLLTPGPTPLYPPALHAMMASDIHHRTEDFRTVYKAALAGLQAPYADVVAPERLEQAPTAEPATRGVFVQASETSAGAAHDVRRMAEAVRNSGAIFVVDAITGIGTMPLDIDAWGLDVVIGG